MNDWIPDLGARDRPHYLAIADLIAADIAAGRLRPGTRLPPQRRLAARLGIDFTTVARGYVEAKRRGLVDSRIGQGTFVRVPPASAALRPGALPVDLSMNLPPEPDDPPLIHRMREGLAEIGGDIAALLRYQGFGGSPADKDAASIWLGRRGLVPSQDRVFVTPGAHPALLALFGMFAAAGETILCEAITYPGVRAITRQLGMRLVGVPMDAEGIVPEALEEACRRSAPKCLYLNPTLQNPTTITVPMARRAQIVEIARAARIPIIEDDAYGFIPQHGPPPFAAMAADITWHVAGLAKCVGAGLRVAYVVAPSAKAGWPFAAALRAMTVMAAPLTVALATRWIEDGTADQLLRFIRNETAARQALAREALAGQRFRSDPLSFHLWLELPHPWTRSAFAGQMRATGIGVVPSDAFAADGAPGEAVRIGLGGPVSRAQLCSVLDYMAHALANPPDHDSAFF